MKEMDDSRVSSSPIATTNLLSSNGVRWISAAVLAGQPWLWHGFSTRLGGVSTPYSPRNAPSELNLGFTPADSELDVGENRKRFISAVTDSRETPLVTVRQTHSNVSVVIKPPLDMIANLNQSVCDGDGLITNEPGIVIGVQTADCIPVLVADPAHYVVAAFHAGWRGTVEGIVEQGIVQMAAEFGSQPSDLVAAIGPGIGSCCYSVGQEVVERFTANFLYGRELFLDIESPHLNLIEANRRQLLTAGLKPESIQVVGGCTSCNPQLFYSHRASAGYAGRMMSVIGVRTR